MNVTFITYVLKSKLDNNFYVGYTTNLKQRLDEHNSGRVKSTKARRPFEVVYYEVCYNQNDALHREKYLKSSYGKRYIKNRLKYYLTGFTP
jgi:putative endonuclease